MEFENKVVLITGGGSGIGKAAAARFLAEGARVVINGRNADKLKLALAELDPSGDRVDAVAGNIADPATSQELVRVGVDRFGGVDVLVNNAGVFTPKGFLDHTPEDLERYLDPIVRGTFFASQAAVPQMISRGGGAIVNTGSLWGAMAVGATPTAAFSLAMAGRQALTRNLAIELAVHRIRVNAVQPGAVETPIYESFLSAEQIREVLPTFGPMHPLGRIGQPNEVADLIVFLASARAAFITGAVVPVDGGVTAGLPA
ncbi:SDR family NAD(P)-dependent oxidoreductase [uncultured Arthrobacter sp.]|uniref:SDR family NAD(P)-dependent oxidoreductase n=1 Tax=uncultured Arthrobacter sp. TaxID=114050 RepID=UPI0025D6D9E2|nr:glucose 1-dehydrogenase [uncultured Arthrobacter sp.]